MGDRRLSGDNRGMVAWLDLLPFFNPLKLLRSCKLLELWDLHPKFSSLLPSSDSHDTWHPGMRETGLCCAFALFLRSCL